MNNKQIKDMAQPTDDNDATTKKYFDDKLEQSHLVSSIKQMNSNILQILMKAVQI